MRQPVIIANWKMNKTIEEGKEFASSLPMDKILYQKVAVVVCPPFTVLPTIREGLSGKEIKWGGQNLYPAVQGAFTGEISPLMLRDLGCHYVILGHSERRHLLAEKNEFIRQKVKVAFEHGLLPILCVGETLAQREKGETEKVCRQQLLESLRGIAEEDVAKMVLAYEPVWAIGTGVYAGEVAAEETISFLRTVIGDVWGSETGQQIRILYGGSVNHENIKEFMGCANIDGALVGGASLSADSFYQIIRGAGQVGKVGTVEGER